MDQQAPLHYSTVNHQAMCDRSNVELWMCIYSALWKLVSNLKQLCIASSKISLMCVRSSTLPSENVVYELAVLNI